MAQATPAALGAIEFLQVEPTTRCNFTCGFCAGRSMPQADLAFERFEAALAAAPGLKHIELQGEGESLMHPRFFDMVALARQRGAQVSLITNGSFFSEAVIARILELGIAKISFSLESADPETFREIRGGKLDKVLRGVEALLAERARRSLAAPIVGMSITVLQKTRHELPAILALYRRLGLDGGITMQPLERKADYAGKYDEAMAREALSDEESGDLWVKFLANREVRKIQQAKDRLPVKGFYDELMAGWQPSQRRCPWLERGVYVNMAGEASPCCMVKDTARHGYGRLGEDPIATILDQRERLRRELASGKIPEACTGCELARFAVIGKPQLVYWGLRGLWERWFGRL